MTAQVIPHPFLAQQLAEAEREALYAADKYDGLRDGTRLWQQEYPEVFTHCADPQQAAEEQAASELDEARAGLDALTKQAETAATGRPEGGQR